MFYIIGDKETHETSRIRVRRRYIPCRRAGWRRSRSAGTARRRAPRPPPGARRRARARPSAPRTATRPPRSAPAPAGTACWPRCRPRSTPCPPRGSATPTCLRTRSLPLRSTRRILLHISLGKRVRLFPVLESNALRKSIWD